MPQEYSEISISLLDPQSVQVMEKLQWSLQESTPQGVGNTKISLHLNVNIINTTAPVGRLTNADFPHKIALIISNWGFLNPSFPKTSLFAD